MKQFKAAAVSLTLLLSATMLQADSFFDTGENGEPMAYWHIAPCLPLTDYGKSFDVAMDEMGWGEWCVIPTSPEGYTAALYALKDEGYELKRGKAYFIYFSRGISDAAVVMYIELVSRNEVTTKSALVWED